LPQEHALATVTRKLEREHGQIDWKQSAERIANLVRAYDPWPGTFCYVQIAEGKRLHLKIWRANVVPEANACPVGGTVLDSDQRLLVSCGSGVIELTEVQLEGRKRMSACDFLRGHPLAAGDVLG
jgi:methionyl-tRNA formyltransferase